MLQHFWGFGGPVPRTFSVHPAGVHETLDMAMRWRPFAFSVFSLMVRTVIIDGFFF